jgi:hypothetical protein
MDWDIVGRGSFHRHIMTSRGIRATTPKAVQFESEFTFAATPTIETVETQSIAMVALIDTSCMLQA